MPSDVPQLSDMKDDELDTVENSRFSQTRAWCECLKGNEW